MGRTYRDRDVNSVLVVERLVDRGPDVVEKPRRIRDGMSRPGWAGFRWPVFDRAVPLAEVPDGYRAMDDRSALKVRITCRARGSAARMVPPFHAAPS
ncbi:hypothetical protein SALBM311S_04484 [Streptomyces alboniger]